MTREHQRNATTTCLGFGRHKWVDILTARLAVTASRVTPPLCEDGHDVVCEVQRGRRISGKNRRNGACGEQGESGQVHISMNLRAQSADFVGEGQ